MAESWPTYTACLSFSCGHGKRKGLWEQKHGGLPPALFVLSVWHSGSRAGFFVMVRRSGARCFSCIKSNDLRSKLNYEAPLSCGTVLLWNCVRYDLNKRQRSRCAELRSETSPFAGLMQPRKRTDCVGCPVHADVRNILFTQTSSVYAHFFWLDDFENLELSFRKGTLFVADFLCQALERRQLHNACLVSSSWKRQSHKDSAPKCFRIKMHLSYTDCKSVWLFIWRSRCPTRVQQDCFDPSRFCWDYRFRWWKRRLDDTCRMRVSLSVGWRPHPPYSIRVSIPDISAVTL